MPNMVSLPVLRTAAAMVAFSAAKRRLPAPKQPPALVAQPLVAPDLAASLRYADVHARYDVPGFVQFYNDKVAPLLTTQEAAFEMLAIKLAYRAFEGDELCFNVQNDLAGNPVNDIAPRYSISETISGAHGCVVQLLKPTGTGARQQTIVLFRGTKKQVRPSGLRSNVDLAGVGHRAFTEVQGAVVAWVDDAIREGRDVCIVGHSLGGACGMLLLDVLSEDARNHCRLFSYNAPKSTRAVATRLAAASRRIFISCFPTDIVSYGGKAWPPGVKVISPVIKGAWARMSPHRRPCLSEQQINGEALTYVAFRPSRWFRFLPIDTTRRTLGVVAPWAFPR